METIGQSSKTTFGMSLEMFLNRTIVESENAILTFSFINLHSNEQVFTSALAMLYVSMRLCLMILIRSFLLTLSCRMKLWNVHVWPVVRYGTIPESYTFTNCWLCKNIDKSFALLRHSKVLSVWLLITAWTKHDNVHFVVVSGYYFSWSCITL